MSNSKKTTSEINRLSLENFKLKQKIDIKIVLDNLRSGLNIGSIFRTADAFNIKKIYITGISAVPPNKEIVKTALGATESVDWEYVKNPVDLIQILKEEGDHIYAIEQTLNSLSLEDFRYEKNESITLIFGNEVEGVNQDLIDLCHGSIEIPQFGTKHSLNVSVTAGIVIWHLVNQNLKEL